MEPTSHPALVTAQTLTQSDAFQQLAPPLQIAIFLTSLSFLTLALVCLTAFTRIIIVLSFVRRALTTQEIPPTPVVMGLAIFLTLFVMAPTFQLVFDQAILPYQAKSITGMEAVTRGAAVMRDFMLTQTRTADLQLFFNIADVTPPSVPQETPMRVLVPSFMISELKTAFIMGFCLYVPFIVIDLIVSITLMSLGMMMMPPVVISAPLKILLFVLVDGWQLICRAVTISFM
jgi:flagellar biosynthesis protein FliP